MRKLVFGLKLAAAGLLLTVVTTAATALVALFGDSDCLRGAVLRSVVPSPTLRISADGRVLESRRSYRVRRGGEDGAPARDAHRDQGRSSQLRRRPDRRGDADGVVDQEPEYRHLCLRGMHLRLHRGVSRRPRAADRPVRFAWISQGIKTGAPDSLPARRTGSLCARRALAPRVRRAAQVRGQRSLCQESRGERAATSSGALPGLSSSRNAW